MAEIQETGYQDIRDRIEANWTYLELEDDTGATLVRLAPEDLSWEHVAGAQELIRQAVVTGQTFLDAGLTLPITVRYSALYLDDVSDVVMSRDEQTLFTFRVAGDQLTLRHTIQVPQAV